MPSQLKRWVLIFIALICLPLLVVYAIGGLLLAPQNREIGKAPKDFAVEDVSFSSESGAEIHGWWRETANAKGSVLLLHGIRADRRSMLNRARFLTKAGYHVLLIDFQAHGESQGTRLTFGKLESLDAAAALAFIKSTQPDLPIAVIGSSLGGASAILCRSEVKVNALVVEAVFSSIQTATKNRLKITTGKATQFLSPLLTAQIPFRLDCSLNEISPLENIQKLNSPILIINGTEDQRATVQEARKLYEKAPEPKQLWLIDGAAHIDLHSYAKPDYEKRILVFLDSNR